MKYYIEVDASKELPTKNNYYGVIISGNPDCIHSYPFNVEDNKWVNYNDDINVTHWLKPVDLTEIIKEKSIAFGKWTIENFYENDWTGRVKDEWRNWKNGSDERYTTEQLFELYLKSLQ